jgi:hypothetical protein
MTQDNLCARLALTALTLTLSGCTAPSGPDSVTDTDTSTSTSTSTSTTSTSSTSTTSTASTSTTSDAETTSPDPFCGDGLQDPDEECDDGPGNADNAACTAACTRNICGDGLLHAGIEACDDGPDNADNAACTATCALNVCGDGLLFEGVEACDDGPDNADNAACTATCAVNICGDFLLHEGVEECDFAQIDGCVSCKLLPLFVFVSSEKFEGDLPSIDSFTGLDLADAHCQTMAINAGRPGNYQAWLSSADEGPADRFVLPPEPRPFLLLDNQPIAKDWHDLTDGALLRPINLDEGGHEVGSALVWTNTNPDGTPAAADHCDVWSTTATLTQGLVGATEFNDAGWTNITTTSCAAAARLYCFQVTHF